MLVIWYKNISLKNFSSQLESLPDFLGVIFQSGMSELKAVLVFATAADTFWLSSYENVSSLRKNSPNFMFSSKMCNSRK